MTIPMMHSPPAPEAHPPSRRWEAAVWLTGAAFAAGVVAGIDFLNGPWYWKWPWQDLGLARTAAFLFPPLVLVAADLRRIERGPAPADRPLVLGLLAAAHFLFQVLGALADPRGFGRIGAIVASPVATSYFTDALEIGNLLDWLGSYPDPGLHLHSRTHPPGPILFYHVLQGLFGPERGALAGALLIAAGASAGIYVFHAFAGLWTEDGRARLAACAYLALLPGLIVFFPEFDQVYPILAMSLILYWVRALRGDRRAAWILGALLFVSTLFAYNLLVVGAFLAAFAARRVVGSREELRPVLRSAATALGTAVLLHAFLWAATGYDAVGSFLAALSNQAAIASGLDRPWLPCAAFDLYDFFLGAGVLALPLVLLALDSILEETGPLKASSAMTLLGLATILIVDLTGLLRAETARVWLFLQPLAALPAALALQRFPAPARAGLLALQWIILVCLKSRMSFVDP